MATVVDEEKEAHKARLADVVLDDDDQMHRSTRSLLSNRKPTPAVPVR
jgi:hypothetical protein